MQVLTWNLPEVMRLPFPSVSEGILDQSMNKARVTLLLWYITWSYFCQDFETQSSFSVFMVQSMNEGESHTCCEKLIQAEIDLSWVGIDIDVDEMLVLVEYPKLVAQSMCLLAKCLLMSCYMPCLIDQWHFMSVSPLGFLKSNQNLL